MFAGTVSNHCDIAVNLSHRAEGALKGFISLTLFLSVSVTFVSSDCLISFPPCPFPSHPHAFCSLKEKKKICAEEGGGA